MEELIKKTARKFRKVNCTWMRLIEKKVSTTGVYRGQHQTLMHIAHHPNASQAEIAEWMDISPAALAVSLKKLEKGGYIVRCSDVSDERRKRIELTELGNEIVAVSHKMFMEIEQQMFSGFSEKEIEEVNQYMNRILENMLSETISGEGAEMVRLKCNKEEK